MGICVCMQAIPGKKEDDTGIPDMYRNTLYPALQETLRVQGKVAPIPQEGRCSKYRYINKNSEIPLSQAYCIRGKGISVCKYDTRFI